MTKTAFLIDPILLENRDSRRPAIDRPEDNVCHAIWMPDDGFMKAVEMTNAPERVNLAGKRIDRGAN
jgi:hypothetical protein